MNRFKWAVWISTFALIAILDLYAVPARTGSPQIAIQNGSLGSSDQRFDGVRAKIQKVMQDAQLPSISVGVAQHGKIIWEQGFGLANVEQLRPATSDTMYSLASISKPFTATAIMSLVHQGKIKLDSPANDYLGASKLRGLAGGASAATIHRILDHTSGLPLHWQFFYTNEDYRWPAMDGTIDRYGILVNPPGEVFQYSNLGFGILAHIAALTFGEDDADALRDLVFTPLALPHTSLGVTPSLAEYSAARYDSHMRPLPDYTFDHLGASAVYSSAHDLIRFAMFHLKDHLSDQKQILDDQTLDLMHKGDVQMDGSKEFYGLGFFGTSDEHGLKEFGHNGGMPGVSTTMCLYPEEDLAVVALTNASPSDVYSGEPAIPQIQQEIVAALVPNYAKARTASPKEAEPSKNEYKPTPELNGTWTGTVRTWQSTLPLKMVFQPDGDIHVKLGGEFEALMDRPVWRGKMLVGLFPGFIPTPDANRQRAYIRLELWQRNGKLEGEANAEASDEPAHYSLASYFELNHTTQ